MRLKLYLICLIQDSMLAKPKKKKNETYELYNDSSRII